MVKKAFTLVEMLAVVSLISILFIIFIPRLDFATNKTKEAGLLVDFRSYQLAFGQAYRVDTEFTSKAESDLVRLINNYLDEDLRVVYGGGVGYSIPNALDPWGTPYKFISLDNKYYILSAGPDTKFGGDDAQIISDINSSAMQVTPLSDYVSYASDLLNTANFDNYALVTSLNISVGGIDGASNDLSYSIIKPSTKPSGNGSGSGDAVVIESISVTKQPNKLEYTEGESFDSTGMEITAHYSDGSTSIITGWTIVGGENLFIGQNTVQIEYNNGGEKFSGQVQIVVNESKPIEIGLNRYTMALLGIYDDSAVVDLSMPIVGTDGKTYIVTSIGYQAFLNNESINRVILGGNIKEIASNAFSNAINFNQINLEDSKVVEIGQSAFINCSIKHIKFPSTLEIIGDSAFANTNIEEVHFSSSIKNIGDAAFLGCTDLRSVVVPGTVENLGINIFSGSGSAEYTLKVECNIPSHTLTTNGVFGNSKFGRIEVANSVTYIGDHAFAHSEAISISIPSTVEYLGEEVFIGCTNLGSIVIPRNLQHIPSGLLTGCKSLTSITVPYGVRSIGISAFMDCSNLTYVSLPDTLEVIYKYAFLRDISLRELRVPSSVKYIWDDAFKGVNTVYYNGDATGSTWGANRVVGG